MEGVRCRYPRALKRFFHHASSIYYTQDFLSSERYSSFYLQTANRCHPFQFPTNTLSFFLDSTSFALEESSPAFILNFAHTSSSSKPLNNPPLPTSINYHVILLSINDVDITPIASIMLPIFFIFTTRVIAQVALA